MLIKPKTNLVVSSNDLLLAKYILSLWEKRVFTFAVWSIKKEDKKFELQRFYVKDIVAFFGTGGGSSDYHAILSAPKTLYDLSIEIPYFSEKGHQRYGEARLVTKYTKPEEKEEGNDYVEMKFSEDLRPHLLELKNRFTKYDIKNVVGLGSFYSWRMFELLKTYEYKKKIELEVDYIREFLTLGTKYKLYADFKRYILEKSQKDLLMNCDIHFTYEEDKKHSRKVKTIKFAIKKNDPAWKPEEHSEEQPDTGNFVEDAHIIEDTNDRSDEIFDVVKEWGITAVKLNALTKSVGLQQVRRAMTYTQNEIAKRIITKPGGYFITMVNQPDFFDPREKKREKNKLVREKNAKAKKLKAELDRVVDEYSDLVNEKIRQLVTEDEQANEKTLKHFINTKPKWATRRLEKYNLKIEELTIQLCRDDKVLRGMFKGYMIDLHKEYFSELINKYEPQLDALQKELKALK